MKWKRFKKERIFLNYTVMLLPHSQKKPIHFKTPVWTFGLFFLGLLILSGTCLFFAGSRIQLREVQREKNQLELEWQQLAKQKQQADAENDTLRQAREAQEQELKELEARTKDTIRELEELVERENEIREELGIQDEAVEVYSSSSAVPSVSRKERSMSFHSIQSELNYLQTSLSAMSGQYDSYLNTITAKKEVEAAEKARLENLRASIVSNALQYVGNAYVYGGTDPHTGVDCSGFTRYILSHVAGVYLGRTAAAQSAQGKTVSPEEARPGDLVFYSSGSHVDHVAIYIGNGRIVHASNEKTGIITSNMYYRTPTRIANVLGN